MGTVYSLVNLRTKSLFELGKSGYEFAHDLSKRPDQSEAELKKLVEDWWYYDGRHRGEAPSPEDIAYVDWLVPRLMAFVAGTKPSELKVVNDCDDSEYRYRELGFPQTDCRYSDPKYHHPACPECRSTEDRSGLLHTRFCSKTPRYEVD
jgi:hypothetical protein